MLWYDWAHKSHTPHTILALFLLSSILIRFPSICRSSSALLSQKKSSTDKINTTTFKVRGKFWENKHLHQRKCVGMTANAHEVKETLHHGNQVIWLLYVECPELVCYHTTWKNRPYGAVSPSAGWLLRGPYFCDYCMDWLCLSSVCEMNIIVTIIKYANTCTCE